ncbi:MAG: ABC transporter permease [Bacteroidaceae bacterium]|nr:ABC transporter permease [Bacteroidaceae bacterium]MBR1801300.1 ABC transporter permease [Bacteroidaceae bacterium]
MLKALWHIIRRELRAFGKRPIFLMIMFVAPLGFLWMFTSLMQAGLPTKLPAALVDEDDTHVTRQLTRILGTMEETQFVMQTHSFTEARQAMQRGEVYAIFRIPKGTTEAALTQRQPVVSFYTNDTYYVAASLLMKDMRKMGEMAGLAMTRETMRARGFRDDQIMGTIQPIVVESHPLGNPHLNYSVVLSNLIVPGLLMLIIMLTTSYSLGNEWKRGRQRHLYEMAGGRTWVAVVGKLLPQTVLYTIIFWLIDLVFYSYLDFPCHCGIPRMMLWGFLSVVASQGFGLVLFELFPGQMRMAMSACSLLGVMQFSLAGFSFPVSAMDLPFQWLSNIFPLHHYFLIYVNQALNGYSVSYVWPHVIALVAFVVAPLLLTWRLTDAFLHKEYRA